MTGPLELCNGAVLVYFEGCAATHVATFADDELYARCVRALEAAAKRDGCVLSESVNDDEMPEVLLLSTEQLKALRKVVDYAFTEEMNHYLADPKGERHAGHIWHDLAKLAVACGLYTSEEIAAFGAED